MSWKEKLLIELLMVLFLLAWLLVIASMGFEGNGPGRLTIIQEKETEYGV